MRTSTSRTLARLGFGAAVVAGSGLFALPAHAAGGADLAVSFANTTLAADADGKFGKLTVTNNGPDGATGAAIAIDVAGLDATKVEVQLAPSCATAGSITTCQLADDELPQAGGSVDLPIPIAKKPGASGAAGSLTVTVTSTADSNSANDAATATLTIGAESGVDLLTVADDVHAVDENNEPTTDPVPPGGMSSVFAVVVNQGDYAAVGLNLVVSLPEHVTFAGPEPDCVYSVDNRVATCSYEDLTLQPFGSDPDEAFVAFYWPITIGADAPGSGVLPDGLVTADAILEGRPGSGDVPQILPRNAKWGARADLADVDALDNSDGFVVFVGELASTGNKAALIAGIGGGLLTLGSGLYLLGRRRRVATSAA